MFFHHAIRKPTVNELTHDQFALIENLKTLLDLSLIDFPPMR